MKLIKTCSLILGVSMILSACSSEEKESKDETKEVSQKEVKHEEKQNISLETKLLVKEAGGPFLDISYPVISGMTDTKEQEAINDEFLNTAKQLEEEARKMEKDIDELKKEMGNDYGVEEHASASLTVQNYFANDRFISLSLYAYSSGGGTGMEYPISFVYDLHDKKTLNFADIFENDIPKEQLVNLINEELTKEYQDMVLETVTDVTKDQYFNLTKDDVVILFNKYQYTAGAAGAPEVKIPKSSLPSLKEIYK